MDSNEFQGKVLQSLADLNAGHRTIIDILKRQEEIFEKMAQSGVASVRTEAIGLKMD